MDARQKPNHDGVCGSAFAGGGQGGGMRSWRDDDLVPRRQSQRIDFGDRLPGGVLSCARPSVIATNRVHIVGDIAGRNSLLLLRIADRQAARQHYRDNSFAEKISHNHSLLMGLGTCDIGHGIGLSSFKFQVLVRRFIRRSLGGGGRRIREGGSSFKLTTTPKSSARWRGSSRSSRRSRGCSGRCGQNVSG